jgi:hypothetical protein
MPLLNCLRLAWTIRGMNNMQQLELSALMAALGLLIAYLIKRKFWPVDAPPPKDKDDEPTPPTAS